VILFHAPSCSCKSNKKRKEKKGNINNDLAILPSHDIFKVQKVVAFFEAVGKRRLPFAEGVVTLFLFAK